MEELYIDEWTTVRISVTNRIVLEVDKCGEILELDLTKEQSYQIRGLLEKAEVECEQVNSR